MHPPNRKVATILKPHEIRKFERYRDNFHETSDIYGPTPAVGGGWRVAVGGGWRLAVVAGGWRSLGVVFKGYP